MTKKVPVRCMRCGKDYGEMEFSDDVPGNVVWGYCPSCRYKAEKPLAEFAAKNTLEAVVKKVVEDKLDHVIKRILRIEERLEAIEKNLDALFKAYKRLQNEELKNIKEWLRDLDDRIDEVAEWARDEDEVREIAHEVAEKVAREIAEEEIFRWVKRESLYY